MAAAVRNGQTFVGIRSVSPTVSAFHWYNLSTGLNYPTDTCSATVNNLGGNIAVQVLTTGGQLWEMACTAIAGTPPTLSCSNVWTPLAAPPFPRKPAHGHQPQKTAPSRPAGRGKTAR
ncbi:hypothetical protein [Streptomyces shenzhenensis]|uniref:hypothetical protein n=1 Tax=Streptomyces shenzhenensis TaxID=943815 RepID=UPI001C691C8C|nr:hypothetical protein [Streptomyces shenzhenensis]